MWAVKLAVTANDKGLKAVPETMLDTETIAGIYADREIRSRLSDKNRLDLLSMPHCPPQVLTIEASSKVRQVAMAAVSNPHCPADALVKAWGNHGAGLNILGRNRFLEHPNFPEEYRQLVRLAQ